MPPPYISSYQEEKRLESNNVVAADMVMQQNAVHLDALQSFQTVASGTELPATAVHIASEPAISSAFNAVNPKQTSISFAAMAAHETEQLVSKILAGQYVALFEYSNSLIEPRVQQGSTLSAEALSFVFCNSINDFVMPTMVDYLGEPKPEDKYKIKVTDFPDKPIRSLNSFMKVRSLNELDTLEMKDAGKSFLRCKRKLEEKSHMI